MKSKFLKIIATISYYPRILVDSILFCFIKNDYSLLDKFCKKDCLIVGNGPSLNKTPLDKIDMPSIGMNKINMLFDKTTWRPDLIVCVNGLVINQNKDFFNTTSIPLVFPIKALYLGIKKRPNVIFIKNSNKMAFSEDIKKKVGIGSTVTYTCLQIAAFVKVKSVKIVGVDHSFKYHGDSNEIKIFKGNDANHFDPNYFKDKLWGLPDLDGSEQAYILAKNYFDKKNISITDCTINGKLMVFDKGTIEDIITI